MPQPSTTGGGLMGYPTTVDTGLVQPFGFYQDNADSFDVGTGALSANTAYLTAATLSVPVILTGIRFRIVSGGAGHYDIGLYDVNGNLLTHSGSTSSSTAMITYSPANALPLSPGRYWLALWTDNATDTYLRMAVGTSVGATLCQIGGSSSGLPASSSSLTGLATSGTRPGIIGIIQGGFS